MKHQIKTMRRELEQVKPHIPEYDAEGKVRMVRNLKCPHCDILAKYMMLEMRGSYEQRRK